MAYGGMAGNVVTELELQREVDALRKQRRLSVTCTLMDPDLPNLNGLHDAFGTRAPRASLPHREAPLPPSRHSAEPPASPPEEQLPSPSPPLFGSTAHARYADLLRQPHSPGSPPSTVESGPDSPVSPSPTATDPSHLFWVPAQAHPEISPEDFRAFLKEQAERNVSQHLPSQYPDTPAAHPPSPDTTPASGASPSWLVGRSTSLTRRSSSLRRQYRPGTDKDAPAEGSVPRRPDFHRASLLSEPPIESRRVAAGYWPGGARIDDPISLRGLQQMEKAAAAQQPNGHVDTASAGSPVPYQDATGAVMPVPDDDLQSSTTHVTDSTDSDHLSTYIPGPRPKLQRNVRTIHRHRPSPAADAASRAANGRHRQVMELVDHAHDYAAAETSPRSSHDHDSIAACSEVSSRESPMPRTPTARSENWRDSWVKPAPYSSPNALASTLDALSLTRANPGITPMASEPAIQPHPNGIAPSLLYQTAPTDRAPPAGRTPFSEPLHSLGATNTAAGPAPPISARNLPPAAAARAPARAMAGAWHVQENASPRRLNTYPPRRGGDAAVELTEPAPGPTVPAPASTSGHTSTEQRRVGHAASAAAVKTKIATKGGLPQLPPESGQRSGAGVAAVQAPPEPLGHVQPAPELGALQGDAYAPAAAPGSPRRAPDSRSSLDLPRPSVEHAEWPPAPTKDTAGGRPAAAARGVAGVPALENDAPAANMRPPGATDARDAPPVPPRAPPPAQPAARPEKKSAFGLSWFGLSNHDDDASSEREQAKKKEKLEKRERKQREKEDEEPTPKRRDRDTFLASLFSKRKGTANPDQESPRSRARHLFGGSPSTAAATLEEFPYARYPLQVERALYRLSHFKLANPHRMLQEQVVISNLMFWYLSIINVAQGRPAPHTSTASNPNGLGLYGEPRISEYDDAMRRNCAGTGPVAVHTGTLARAAPRVGMHGLPPMMAYPGMLPMAGIPMGVPPMMLDGVYSYDAAAAGAPGYGMPYGMSLGNAGHGHPPSSATPSPPRSNFEPSTPPSPDEYGTTEYVLDGYYTSGAPVGEHEKEAESRDMRAASSPWDWENAPLADMPTAHARRGAPLTAARAPTDHAQSVPSLGLCVQDAHAVPRQPTGRAGSLAGGKAGGGDAAPHSIPRVPPRVLGTAPASANMRR
ncbi:hypothetical protein MSPP1_001386 [Malassezia sp. CBS 17886]|nr:hypothetical protein MSPP1_001386 [Malassezia sp. CBS 17886]